MALTVNDESKPQTTLLEYSREIGPKIRELLKKKEILKEFKDENEEVEALQENIKLAQEELKDFLKKHDDFKDIYEGIAELEKELKQAIKGAERATDGKYDAATLKAFFTARAKEAVDKVTVKGDLFKELTKELDGPAKSEGN